MIPIVMLMLRDLRGLYSCQITIGAHESKLDYVSRGKHLGVFGWEQFGRENYVKWQMDFIGEGRCQGV